MNGQELDKPFLQPTIKEVDIGRRFNRLVAGVQARTDLVARRFPEVSPPGPLRDIFRLATKEEMADFCYAEHDERLHPLFSREELAEQVSLFVSQHRAIATGDAVLIDRESFLVDDSSSLMRRFMHETGHIIGGEKGFIKNLLIGLFSPGRNLLKRKLRMSFFLS